MIKIDNKIYCSRDFLPIYSSETDDYKKNDNKIASDSIEVKPLSISTTFFYRIKDVNENKNDSIKFIEDIIYLKKLITIVDLDNGVEYNDMHISNFNVTGYYSEGFIATLQLKYVPVTDTAVTGKTSYNGYIERNSRIIQKPLKKLTLNKEELPFKTLEILEESGPLPKTITLNTLDFKNSSNLTSSANFITEKIQTNLPNFKGVFELGKDGTFDILDSLGNTISMGQRLMTNVELLANTIPGVNISLKLLPITQKAGMEVFEMSRLGKDFIINASEVKKDINSIVGGAI